MDGKTVPSCMTLALDSRGKEITTVEGLGRPNGRKDEIQEAFASCDAYQCGFCTRGMIMSANALLDKNDSPTDAEIRDGLSGNICRCSAYIYIFEAVKKAGQWKREGF